MKKQNIIYEERGVAAFPYNDVIKEICEWTKKKVLKGERQLYVPRTLTKKITFIGELFLNIHITECGDNYNENNVGEGRCGDSKGTQLTRNGKMECADIDIYSFSYNSILDMKTLYSPLYHELHHAYETWMDLKRNGSTEYSNRIGWKSNFRAYDISDSDIQTSLSFMCYQLHSENEFNALASDVYGELKSMNSTRENFHQDIKQTWAYKVYIRIKNDLPKVINYLRNNPYQAKSFFEGFEYRGGKFNPYNKNVNGYIDEFNRKTKFLLQKLMKSIGKSASLYYDTIDNNTLKENKVIITINELINIITENLNKFKA